MRDNKALSCVSALGPRADLHARLFGIANINNYSAAGAYHPISLTEVGKALGYKGWHSADSLIYRVSQKKGVDIKKSDNRYHRAEKVNKTVFHKYSADAIELLRKERDGEEYELDMGIPAEAK